jgi:Ca2+-binding RTX toxin-like protein
VDLTLGSATLSAYGDTFRNFERFDLVLGKGNDTVVAGAEDTIDGGAGHDLLRGGGSLIGGDGNDRLDGDAGKDTLSGGAGDDTLYGADGNDELRDDGGRMDAGAGDDSLLASGGACSMTGGSGADRFYFTLGNADTVLDFESGVDVFAVDDWLVGNGNKRLDNALTVDGPGGFSNKAELVIVKADIAGGIDAAKAAAAIGSATSAYTPWDNMLFVVDNGTDSAVFRFDSNGSDAVVGANELSLLATLQGVAETVVTDYVLY